jgi:Zn-dependent protease
MAEEVAAVELVACPGCGAALDPALLACPSCAALVHSTALKQLAARAQERQEAGDLSGALAAWREAIELLPDGAQQRAKVGEKIVELSRAVERGARPSGRGGWQAGAIGATTLGLLGKGKLLLAGLTKASTLWSMLLTFGVYFKLWGWKFALGFVATTYVHEMGHVMALRRYGLPASAPMFIPGIGALVRLKQHPATVTEDAQVGLAGPIWGLAAAATCWLVGRATGWQAWLAVARIAGYLNLFNLLPLGSLDGGRAFRALSRLQRVGALAAIGVAWWLSHSIMLPLVGIGALVRVAGDAPAEGHVPSFLEYVGLIAALSFLSTIAVGV